MAGRHNRREPVNQRRTRNANAKQLAPNNQQKRRRRILLASTGVVILALAGAAYATIIRPKNPGINVKPIPLPKNEQNRITTLLIGTDTRPGQTGGNTDTLIVMSIDYVNKRIELMSVPRDTKVMFPDGTYGKINSAYDIGGVALTVNMVQNLIGLGIPHYAVTHFGGLVNIINTIGGVTVDVPERMNYDTGDKQYGVINLYPGVQTLSGEQALGFVRFREDALGDIGRTMRQQAFLKALEQALFQPSNIVKLPTLISEFWNTVDTNYSLGNLMSVASSANQLKGFKVITETLPGAYSSTAGGAPSYWLVNQQEAQWVTKQFFFDGLIQPNIIQTQAQVENWTPPLPGETAANSGQSSSQSASGGGSNPPSGSSSGSNGGTGQTSTTSSGSSGTSGATTGSTASSGTSSGSSGGSGGSTATTAITPVQMVVTGTSANIRSGPGTNYSVVGSVLQGASVTVIGKAGDWYEVPVAGGGSGYIASFLLGTP